MMHTVSTRTGYALTICIMSSIFVTSCGAKAVDNAPPAVADSTDLHASAYRSRVDDAQGGTFQITLSNVGPESISVFSVKLRSPGFAALPATDRTIDLTPGSQIDIPTQYGDANCDAAVTPLLVDVDASTSGAARTTRSVSLDSPYDIMARIHNEECSAKIIDQALTMTFDLDPLPPPGSAQLARLRIDRASSSDAIRVDEIDGSVLFRLSGDVPKTMQPDQRSIAVAVQIVTSTCAAHAIADSKKPFVFPVFLAFGAEKPVYARIPVSDTAAKQLSAYEQQECRT